jgi:hypothetical protein
MKASLFMCRGIVRSLIYLLVFSVFNFSCVSIKPSTVQLSAEVGERLTEMEKIHQLTVQRYFDMEKQKVEDFLTNTWEPLYLKNFLGTSQVLQLLQNTSRIDDRFKNILREGIAGYLDDKTEAKKAADTLAARLSTSRKGEEGVVRTVLQRFVESNKLEDAIAHINALLGSDEPARIIIDFAAQAHKDMEDQRSEMMAPIEKARAETVATLSASYAELIRGQATITGRLEAAARRSKQQDELLDKLGVSKISQDVEKQLANVSEKVDVAITAAEKAAKQGEGIIPDKILNELKKGLEKPDSTHKNK